MASRGKARKGNDGGFWLWARRILGVSALLSAGVVAGYLWRSYAPLALPFESRLVSDNSSSDLSTASLRDLVATADSRAAKAEAERDRLRARLDKLEKEKVEKDREIADLQIRSVLGADAN